MTKKEAAIVSAYTGVLVGKFSDMCEYVEQILQRPIWTHQYANKELSKEIKEKSKQDFCNISIGE